jgi:tetratricopeptide (TPR) repeat protein
MKHFETHEAARIVDLPESQIRSCVRAGFLSPERGPHNRLWFTFQDLLVLKTTKGLLDSGVPARRIGRLMGSLRRQLAEGQHLSKLTIWAEGDRVVVQDGASSWEPDSGQVLMDLGGTTRRTAPVSVNVEELERDVQAVEAPRRSAIVIDVSDLVRRARHSPETHAGDDAADAGTSLRRAAAELPPSIESAHVDPQDGTLHGLSAMQWFELGCELEGESLEEARLAYRRAIAIDPTLADAHINLGRQCHESGDHAQAEGHYRAATRAAKDDPIAWFNLGVLLEDLRRPDEALEAYREALARDREHADAHYNLGLLLDGLGHRREAMTHLMKARRLYGGVRR